MKCGKYREQLRRAHRVPHRERSARIAQPEHHGAVEVLGLAMRICAMSQPTLTMCATTRCATKPGESRMTDTGTPSAASSAWALSLTSLRVTGVLISVRRLAKPKSGSTATVRAGSRPCSRAQVVASWPSGATRQTAALAGLLSLLPLDTRSFSSGTAHTDKGSTLGAWASAPAGSVSDAVTAL